MQRRFFLLSSLFILFVLGILSLVSLNNATAQESTPTPQATPTLAPIPAPTATPSPAPAQAVTSQESLNAEYIGAEACLACHTNRSDFKTSSHARNFSKIKGIAFEKSCETCHGPGSLHAQAAGDKSNPGFATMKNMKGDVSATCFQCHQDQRRMHWASSPHATRGLTCTSCHSVHESKSHDHLLRQIDEKSTCFQCHQDIKGQIHRTSHMPILEGKMSCGDCHNPHGSATDKMLVAQNVNQLCYKCHAERRGPFLWTHPPAQENCLTCHVPHGSHNDKLLTVKPPMLCQRCHALTGHNNSAYDASQVATQNVRLADKSCINCHIMIHGSNHPSGKFFQR